MTCYTYTGTPLKSGSVKISVNILESNKHAPVFQKSHYDASCLENMGTGSDIITVHAVDIDQGLNGRISYYFQGNSGNNNPGNQRIFLVIIKMIRFQFSTIFQYFWLYGQ